MFSRLDALRLAAILREAAAAEIMPRWRQLAAGAVRTKSGPLDLVTDADEAAERVIEAALAKAFPGCAIVGEEAASADPAILQRLKGADLAFVVDPVDGTANYAAGLPLFGSMAAAIVRGEVAMSVIHDPVGDDSAVAVRGDGAWMVAADGREVALRVAAPVPLAAMSGCASWRYLSEPARTRVHHAPGVLLHREAGGFAARFDGSPYDPTDIWGGLICAPDQASWHALRDALIPCSDTKGATA